MTKQANIAIYDSIGPPDGISAKQFRAELTALGPVDTVHVRLHSPGGAIPDGLAIYGMLKQHPARKIVHVDGMALSMASAVAMAGDEIEMAENGFLMIHNPASIAVGDSEELRSTADLLDKLGTQLASVYAGRTKQPVEKITAMMAAETWFNAEEAVALGFATRSTAPLKLAASFDVSRFANVPQALLSRGKEPMSQATQTAAAADLEQLRAACPGADANFLISQLEAKATLIQAQTAWIQVQNQNLAAARAAGKAIGLEPLGTGAARRADTGDAVAQFNDLVREKMAAGLDRRQAVAAVARRHRQLHHEFVAATNKQSRRVQDLIDERFAD